MTKFRTICTFSLAVALAVASVGESESRVPATDLPVIITSCGQSPGSTMIKVIFMKMKLPEGSFEENGLATADDLKAKAIIDFR